MTLNSKFDRVIKKIDLVMAKDRDSLSAPDLDLLRQVRDDLLDIRKRIDELSKAEVDIRVTDAFVRLLWFFTRPDVLELMTNLLK